MSAGHYDDALFRHAVIMQLIGIRRSIYEGCLACAIMVGGFLAARWEPNAPLIAVAFVVVWALFVSTQERSTQKRLDELFAKNRVRKAEAEEGW